MYGRIYDNMTKFSALEIKFHKGYEYSENIFQTKISHLTVVELHYTVITLSNHLAKVAKKKPPPGFEPGISCLLDRRLNQLGHGGQAMSVKQLI